MTVEELIRAHNETYSAYYGGALYSHVPMALFALKGLGASPERLLAYFQMRTQRLEPMGTSPNRIDPECWGVHLGDLRYESAYAAYFSQRVAKDGADAVIREHFDVLMEGVGAAAFHPVIRLHYAVGNDNDGEIGMALATWAASYLDLGVVGTTENAESIKTIVQELQDKEFEKTYDLGRGRIADRMRAVSRTQQYQRSANKIARRELEPDNLKKHLLWLYAQTGDFTLLHGITSQYAYESLERMYSAEKSKSRIYFGKAILAALLSTANRAPIDFSWSYPREHIPPWSEMVPLATASDDDHVIKLVYTLNSDPSGDFDFERRYCAAKKLRLLRTKASNEPI